MEGVLQSELSEETVGEALVDTTQHFQVSFLVGEGESSCSVCSDDVIEVENACEAFASTDLDGSHSEGSAGLEVWR